MLFIGVGGWSHIVCGCIAHCFFRFRFCFRNHECFVTTVYLYSLVDNFMALGLLGHMLYEGTSS